MHDAHHGFLYCEVDKIRGCEIQLDFPSVGATENIMLTAVFAEGDTVIRHAAKEPEIVDLQKFLVQMGVDVSGAGTSTIRIRGKNKKLNNVEHTVIPDRIVAGTYMVAAGITGGDLNLRNVTAEHLMSVISYLREAGCRVNIKKNNIHVSGPTRPRAVDIIRTLPYPGFPTDMQSQLMSVLCKADGVSVIHEQIFEHRFHNVNELKKMGAIIEQEQGSTTAVITGVGSLHGALVKAHDLRGGAALVIAGLAAEGTTVITEAESIERGYEDICRDFSALGAKIRYCSDNVQYMIKQHTLDVLQNIGG